MVSEGNLMVLTGVAGGVTWLAITIIHGAGFVPQLVALSTMTVEVFLGLLTIHRKQEARMATTEITEEWEKQ